MIFDIYLLGAFIFAGICGGSIDDPSREDLRTLILFTVFWPIVAVAAVSQAIFHND